MSRQIITPARALATSKPEDPYSTTVLKLIPAEVIGVYLAVFNLIKADALSSKTDNTMLQWIVFGVVFIILPFYLRKTAVESWSQVALTMLSFVIWVFTLGGPLDGQLILNKSPQFLGSILLPLYTLLIPLLYKKVDTAS